MDRVVIAIVAFFIGSGMMLSSWKDDAQRGFFEVGGVVYKVERILP